LVAHAFEFDRVTPQSASPSTSRFEIHIPIRDRRTRGRWAGGRRRGRSLRRHCLPAHGPGGWWEETSRFNVTSFHGLIPSCHKTDKPRTIQLNGWRSQCGFGLQNSSGFCRVM
jgi:hypothetical protein